MVDLIALKCPHCGGLLKSGQMKCPYCGAELVLQRGGTSRFKNESSCPNCGVPIEKSSWFCVNCNTVLTTDVDKLKHARQLQSAIESEQEDHRANLPKEILDELEADEYVYARGEILLSKDIIVMTDRKIVRYKDGIAQVVPYDEIVNLSPVVRREGFSLFSHAPATYEFELHTLDGELIFEGVRDLTSANAMRNNFISASSYYNAHIKDVRAIIWKLPLKDRTKGTSETDRKKEKICCGNCAFFKKTFCKIREKDPEREPCRYYIGKPESARVLDKSSDEKRTPEQEKSIEAPTGLPRSQITAGMKRAKARARKCEDFTGGGLCQIFIEDEAARIGRKGRCINEEKTSCCYTCDNKQKCGISCKSLD